MQSGSVFHRRGFVPGWRLALAAAATLVLVGCSNPLKGMLDGGDSDTMAASAGGALSPDMSAANDGAAVAQLYNDGLARLNDGSYKQAAKKFAEVERKYPYSQWATKALLMQAFANYQRNAYDDAINAGQRFISLHPGHRDTPYAYYLVALSNYEQINDVKRDQSQTQKALDALDEVQKRFPESPYAADAAKKAAVARDHLAGKEMEVGRYYVKRGDYLAGINRFKRVVTDYQTTSHTPEALYRLTESYTALGVASEAQTAAAVLGHNYPNSQWYQDAYNLVANGGQAPVENKASWISKAFRSLNPLAN
jgi:outer membrane protein assembly factor BamD